MFEVVTWKVYDCEELVGVTWSVSVSVKNEVDPKSRTVSLMELRCTYTQCPPS